jgi:hypothetical protein
VGEGGLGWEGSIPIVARLDMLASSSSLPRNLLISPPAPTSPLAPSHLATAGGAVAHSLGGVAAVFSLGWLWKAAPASTPVVLASAILPLGAFNTILSQIGRWWRAGPISP